MGAEHLKTIAPCLLHMTEAMVNDGRVGMCPGSISIVDINTSCSTAELEPCGDRFKILIPYAGQSTAWEVLFNFHHPSLPPDFIFGPDDKDFNVDLALVPSLIGWNSKRPECLLRVIEEILYQYKEHHRYLVNQNSRLQFEYSSLVEQGRYRENDIEIHVSRKNEKRIGQVNFLIRLPIDFSKIPSYLTQDNPGEDAAVLLISFHSPDSSKITPQLYLSPRVEYCIGGALGLRIPSWPSGGCLIDYVPSVCKLLEKKVEMVISAFEKRKEYILSFLSHFGKSLLEYDTESFSKISFTLEWNDFFFIYHVDIPDHFPNDQPIFSFQSVYHESNGKPYSKIVNDYPYSPRWSGKEMVERACTFVLEYIGGFQKASISGGSCN